MQLSPTKIAEVCKTQGISLRKACLQAGVSRTAYYHLAKKSSLIPKSVQRLAQVLHVSTQDIVTSEPSAEDRLWRLQQKLSRILRNHPDADRDNVWHALLLLTHPPLFRLQSGLRRGRLLST